MSRDQDDRGFAAFVAGRGTPLLRTAFLLTGDLEEADRVLLDAAARTRLDWKRAGGEPEAYVQQLLVTTRRAHPAPPTDQVGQPDELPAPVADLAAEPDVGHEDAPQEQAPDPEELGRRRVWDAYLTLPPSQRAVLVLGIHEQLDEEEIARLTRRSPRATRAEVARALGWLRTVGDPAGHPGLRSPTERLGDTFEMQTSQVHADRTLADRALSRADELGRNRRRRMLMTTAAVVVVLAVIVAGLALSGTRSGSAEPVAAPSSNPSGRAPTGSASVVAVPDAVLELARDESALIGYDSAIVDGATSPMSVLINVDASTGASLGGRIVGLARAEGGYVVLTRPQADSFADDLLTLSYVPRTGARVELGHVGLATPGFAVASDAQSVVHVIPGPVDGENSLGSGQTELVVQTLSGDVVNRLTVDGPAAPLAMDAERVWYSRPIDPVGAPYVWDRATGDVQRLKVPTGLVAVAVNDNQVLMREDRSDGCFVYVDGSVPSRPVQLWRDCTGGSISAIAPSGVQVALLSGDHPAFALVVDTSNGDIVSQAVTDTAPVTGFSWTADGVKLLVQVYDTLASADSVIAVRPAPGDYAATTTYRLGHDPVVLGRELPIP